MKLRVLCKKVFISESAQKGWKAESIAKEKNFLQQWDDKEGWVNIPTVIESLDVYGSGELKVSDF